MAEYKPIDYVIYGFIMLILIYVAIKIVFSRVKPDRNFAISLIPAIFLSIIIRVSVDAGIYEKSKLWSVTPGVYVLGFIYGLAYLYTSLFLAKRIKIDYWKLCLIIGFIPIPYFAYNLAKSVESFYLFFVPLTLSALISALYYILLKDTIIMRAKENILIIYAHLLDATGTFIGIDFFGFGEEHILPEILINMAGTAFIMIPVKLAVITVILYLLEKWYSEQEVEEIYYRVAKLVMFIIGLGPGIRNSLLLTL